MCAANNHISNLIILYIKGELDINQKNKLNIWLEEPKNKKLFDEIVSKEKILNKSTDYDTFDMKKAWSQIDYEISKTISKKLDYRKLLTRVAIILLPLAIGLLVFNQLSKNEIEKAGLSKIIPGETNAKLYLVNGDVIDLKKDTSRLIQSEDNLLVKKDNRKIKIISDLFEVGKSNKLNRIVTPIGGEYEVELSDGTVVKLNADSYLEFPSKFSNKERRVFAKGELYFDVKSNENWPFIVESGGMDLKVLGTEFNLRAYAEESEMISTLIEGSVVVTNSNGELITLSPGRQVVLNRADQSMLERKANVETVTAWIKGKIIFNNQPLEDIMSDLARWYDIKISFGNDKIKSKKFSIDMPRYGDVESILALMEGTGEVSFIINKNVITIE